MQQSDPQQLFSSLSEKDPKQLKQVIDVLIGRSKILVKTLQETCQKLQNTQQERNFWKDSYFHLKQTLQGYVDTQGIAPFSYITSLQQELRREKVTKSCLQEKFKVMQPRQLNTVSRPQRKDEMEPHTATNRQSSRYHSPYTIKQESRMQSKHKIGPKSIQFFKFKEHKAQ